MESESGTAHEDEEDKDDRKMEDRNMTQDDDRDRGVIFLSPIFLSKSFGSGRRPGWAFRGESSGFAISAACRKTLSYVCGNGGIPVEFRGWLPRTPGGFPPLQPIASLNAEEFDFCRSIKS